MAKTLVGTSFVEYFSYKIWINRVLMIIGLVLITFLLVFHCVNICYLHGKKNKTNANTKRTSIKSNQKYVTLNASLTMAMLIFSLIHQIHDTLDMFGVFQSLFGFIKDCGILPNLTAIWWHCSKFCIYNIYILRLKVAYGESAFGYKDKTLLLLSIVVNIFWIYSIFGDLTEIYGTYQYEPSEGIYWCQLNVAVFGIVMTIAVDATLSILCLVLFLRPLIKIIRYAVKYNNPNAKMESLAIKYLLLTFIAIGSTTIWLFLFLFTEYGAFVAVDININALSVLLMNSIYQRYYVAFCLPCHTLVERCDKTFKNTETSRRTLQHLQVGTAAEETVDTTTGKPTCVTPDTSDLRS
eukprot:206806_1